jgi:hypothetical protein
MEILLEFIIQFGDNAEYVIGRHKIMGPIRKHLRKVNKLIANIIYSSKTHIRQIQEKLIDSAVQQIHLLLWNFFSFFFYSCFSQLEHMTSVKFTSVS